MILGNIIFHYVVNRTLVEDHPTKDYERCINRHQVKHKCTVCADVCPEHVYGGVGCRKSDFTKCVNCNLCVAACPARCIAPSSMNISAYLKLLKIPEKTVFIAAGQYKGNAHLRVEHFAVLPWEYLAYVGLGKRVCFLTAGQPQAEAQVEEIWQKSAAKLKYFFGKEEFHNRFVFSEPPDTGNDQEFNRRDLFKKINEEMKSRVSSVVPPEGKIDGLLYRYLLKEALTGEHSFGWVVPMVSSGCKGCGVCVRLCPQEAIVLKKENGRFRIFLYPVRCNQCGLCQKTCIHQAVDGFGVAHITSLKPVLLFDSAVDGAYSGPDW